MRKNINRNGTGRDDTQSLRRHRTDGNEELRICNQEKVKLKNENENKKYMYPLVQKDPSISELVSQPYFPDVPKIPDQSFYS